MNPAAERLRAAPRCGARTRAGTPCAAPAAHGKGRCRLHGGAPGSGAPAGNRNAWRHGHWSGAAIAERRAATALLAEIRATLRAMRENHGRRA